MASDTSRNSIWVQAGRQRVSRRRALAVVAAGGAAATLLGACNTRAGNKAGTASTNAGKLGPPKRGGQLNFALTNDYSDFDPTSKPSNNLTVISFIDGTLLRYKGGAGVGYFDLNLEPGLAERWEQPDNQTYTFHLRKGAKFFNLPPMNGREVTSADVKWSIEYLRRGPEFKDDKKLTASIVDYNFAGLASIQTPDNYTVVTHFQAPFAPFLNYTAWGWNGILAHEVYEQYGNFSTHLGGTGPFPLDESASQRGVREVHKRQPDFYLPGLPYLDQINAIVLPDDATAFAAFQTKQVDNIGQSTTDSIGYQQVKHAVPDAVLYTYLNTAKNLSMETDRPPFNDARIRKALSLCINRDEYLKAFSEGKGQWALAASKPDLFTDAELKQILQYDPEQAKQLVAAAGYPNGVDAEIIYPPTTYGQIHVNEIQLLQTQAKRGNINVILKPVDKVTESLRQKQGDYQLNLVPKIIVGGDLDGLLYAGFQSSSSANYGHIKDPKLDQLLAAQRQEMDANKRKDLIRQAVRYINEAPLSIGLYHGYVHQFMSPVVKNFAPNYTEPGYDLTEVWVEK